MENQKAFPGLASVIPLGPVKEGADRKWDCGVSESQFPYLGKCCAKSASLLKPGYQALCPYCGIWSSFPDGISLTVAYIVDCVLYGYGRRLTE